ncbi:MAG TPA: hypothetical protein DDX51_01290 [Clostridiales bacterium]|nr:hypothetical protein [Clostridiales bacterium]
MKTKILSALLAGSILLGGTGELMPSALATGAEPAVQQTADYAQTIAIQPNELWLGIGETIQLTASVLPDSAEEQLIWSSSDSAVCAVGTDGTVTAQTAGTAVLTAQAGSLTASCTVHVGIAAPVVSGITVDSTQHAVLSWTAVKGADGYRVSRRASDADPWQDVQTLTRTSWTDTSMTAQTGWQYAVRAYKLRNSQTDDAQTLWSGYARADVPVYEQAPVLKTAVKPAKPYLISAAALASGGVQIKWNPVSGASGYRVYRKNGSSWKQIHIVNGASASSYTDSNVTPGTTYTYSVRAFSRGGGKLLLSDMNTTGVSATVPKPSPAPVSIPAPKLGQVTSGGYDRLTVTWNTVSQAEGYLIYRRTSAAEKWNHIATVTGGSKTSYTDTSVICGKTYYYTIRPYRTADGAKVYGSYNDRGISGKALPATPVLKGASAVSPTSVRVTWKEVAGASGYYIYRKTKASDSWVYLHYVSGGSKTYFLNTGLTSGTRYYYTVAAFRNVSGSAVVGGRNNTGVSATPLAPAAYSNVYASYSTKYNPGQTNRTTNLNVACKTINGTVVKPGETFSFNKKLGKRTPDKGYKPATIFTGGSGTAQELGGGICQVASTMFNTALLSNVGIAERHPHSQRVAYCPLGRDAGIYYGVKDFKFKNTTSYNIKIKAWISDGTLTVQFLTTEQVKPPAVKLTVTYNSGTYTLKRSVNGVVNYTTKSRY